MELNAWNAWVDREEARRQLEDDPRANAGLLAEERFDDEYAPDDDTADRGRGREFKHHPEPTRRRVRGVARTARQRRVLRGNAGHRADQAAEDNRRGADRGSNTQRHPAGIPTGRLYVATASTDDAPTRAVQRAPGELRQPPQVTTLNLPEPVRHAWRQHRKTLHRIAEYGSGGRLLIGGGTILAARWGHRLSEDIDVLLPDRDAVRDTHPGKRNDLAKATGGTVEGSWSDRIKSPTREDEPGLHSGPTLAAESLPRARGCTPLEAAQRRRVEHRPARTGMNQGPPSADRTHGQPPRRDGDRPVSAVAVQVVEQSPPRAHGDVPAGLAARIIGPTTTPQEPSTRRAHAQHRRRRRHRVLRRGSVRRRARRLLLVGAVAIPHTHGDRPVIGRLDWPPRRSFPAHTGIDPPRRRVSLRDPDSPRARGYTPVAHLVQPRQQRCPARTGIHPPSMAGTRPGCRVAPRARGFTGRSHVRHPRQEGPRTHGDEPFAEEELTAVPADPPPARGSTGRRQRPGTPAPTFPVQRQLLLPVDDNYFCRRASRHARSPWAARQPPVPTDPDRKPARATPRSRTRRGTAATRPATPGTVPAIPGASAPRRSTAVASTSGLLAGGTGSGIRRPSVAPGNVPAAPRSSAP